MFNRRYLPPVNTGVSKLPYIVANRLVNQLIPNNITTRVIFNNIVRNDASYFSLNTGTGTLTILNTGLYAFTFDNIWAASALGIRLSQILINDTGNLYTYWSEFTQLGLINTGNGQVSCLQLITFVNATVDFQVYQNTGAALNVGNGNINLQFTVTRLSDY